MAISTPIKPLPLLILHPDQGEKYYAAKTIDFRGLHFVKRVIDFGRVERSFPYPSGLLSVPDAVVSVADPDGEIRAYLNERTPLRRIAEIAWELESHANDPTADPGINFPIDDPQSWPIPEQVYSPFFTGEIVGVEGGPGMLLTLRLRDVASSWLNRKVPVLGVRDFFPNMPDDVESIFIPIILGRCYSLTGTNIDPEGVIKCHHIDTTLHRYVVARHRCFNINAVYRKGHLDARFKLVNPSEYDVVEEIKVINNITYTITYLEFHTQQTDGTEIHTDVSGYNSRWDFDLGLLVTNTEVRNGIDNLVNFVNFTLQDEVNIQQFDSLSFVDTRTRLVNKNLKHDGAITEQGTNGLWISRICESNAIDFFQTNRGLMKVHHYDAELDADAITPLDDSMILNNSLMPAIPADKIFNRIVYRYNRQNSGLAVFRRGTNSGNWIHEFSVDNVPDQMELGANGENPQLEKQVELFFCRDDGTAKKVIKHQLQFHTLRSYQTKLELAGPEIVDYIGISDLLAITQVWGIGSSGFVDMVHRVFASTFDLMSKVATMKCVIPCFISDADLDWSVDDAHDPPEARVRNPMLATYVNGTPDPIEPTRTFPDAAVNIDLQDSYDDEITTEITDIDTPIKTNFGAGPSESQPAALTSSNTNEVAWVGIKWLEDQSTSPRGVKGIVPIPQALIDYLASTLVVGMRLEVGTLDPDTKPTDLDDTDAGKVLFYALDYDRFYIWIGLGDPLGFSPPWTNTGWYGFDNNQGTIAFRFFDTYSTGWALADGTEFLFSQPDGSTLLIETPDLTEGTRFVRMTGTYESEANSNSNAVAPGLGTLATASAGSHDHGGSTGSVTAHTHTIDHSHDASHTHGGGVTGATAAGGSVATDGTHAHDGVTEEDGTHEHTDVISGGNTSSNGDHSHDLTIASDGSHDHSFSSLTTSGPSSTVSVNTDGAADAADDIHTHTVSGTTSSDGDHAHDGSSAASAGAHIHDVAVSGTAGVESSAHAHTIHFTGDGAHSHSFTGSSHTHTISTQIISLVHAGSSGPAGGHSHSISSQAAHTHTFTGTLGTEGKPPSVGLMPYIRL